MDNYNLLLIAKKTKKINEITEDEEKFLKNVIILLSINCEITKRQKEFLLETNKKYEEGVYENA